MTTPADVARWMVEEVQQEGSLSYGYAWEEIHHRFGEDIAWLDERSGRRRIDALVRKEFRKMAHQTVVYVTSRSLWRLRDRDDPPGWQVTRKKRREWDDREKP